MSFNLPYSDSEDVRKYQLKSLTKPSAVERIAKKQARKAEVSKAKGKAEKEDRARMAAIREACYQRDKGMCRACGRLVQLHDANPLLVAECHHMTYRSKQGSDELSNRVTLCKADHEAEHRHRLIISGDPNAILTFTEQTAETGQILRVWQSEVPR